MVDKDSVIGVTDGLTTLVKLLAEFTEALGGGIGLLNILGTTAIKVFSTQISRSLVDLNHNVQSTFENFKNSNYIQSIADQFTNIKTDNKIQTLVDE